jgi:hypothetical protein
MNDLIAPGPPSLNKAWSAFMAHFPAILLIWVTSIAITALGAFSHLLLSVLGLAAAGSADPDTAAAVGLLLGQIGQIPFTILSSFVGVLLIAVPALHYATGEIITLREAFAVLMKRPWRYLLAGLLFSLATGIGIVLCILPGLAVALTGPIFVNKIFNTEVPVLHAFSSSFQVVYGSSEGRSFVWLQLLVWLVVGLVTLFTCGLGALLAVPVSSFYVQNAAYDKGLIRATT